MDCFGTYFTHTQTWDNVRVHSATQWNARLHRCPGLISVLTALKEYREACSNGKCAVSPSNAFQPDALDWLEPQEEKTS